VADDIQFLALLSIWVVSGSILLAQRRMKPAATEPGGDECNLHNPCPVLTPCQRTPGGQQRESISTPSATATENGERPPAACRLGCYQRPAGDALETLAQQYEIDLQVLKIQLPGEQPPDPEFCYTCPGNPPRR
jgi:hypothetical protein